MIYPQRRRFDDSGTVSNTQRARTPPPTFIIWHDTSFMESHWRALEGITIRYYERGSHNERDAKIFAKDNGLSFFVKHLRSGEKTAEVNWKWDEISYMSLTPIRASYRNREFLWIILDGEYAGRYCKAVYAPLEPKPGESATFFTIAFARVVTGEGGECVTVVNTPQEEREVRDDLIGVVWQTKAQRLTEPNVYIGAIGMQKREKEKRGKKRKRAEGGEYHCKLWDVGCNNCGIIVFFLWDPKICGIPKYLYTAEPRAAPRPPTAISRYAVSYS
jgi:hypothetical protein